jgi:two-component system nitrate/nitrite sensor histidine kinase NarX
MEGSQVSLRKVNVNSTTGEPDALGLTPERTVPVPAGVTLGRLRVAGLVLPVLFIVVIELVRGVLIEKSFADYSPNLILAGITIVAMMVFSVIMFHLIARAQGETASVVSDLRRRQREGHAFYDVLLRISNQEPLADILALVARHACGQSSSDHAAVCLNSAATQSVQLDPTMAGVPLLRSTICIVPDADGSYGLHDAQWLRSLRASPDVQHSMEIEVHSSKRTFGYLWLGRSSDVPFSDSEKRCLATFARFASIAVASAGARESETQAAILSERERIARELHDSLAQVLGAVQLRLRAITSREGAVTPATELELTELADACEEGYLDARRAILDLHESSRGDRTLLDSLRAYLDKFGAQSGISTHLETTLEEELSIPPRSEIQIIRVIQEALSNVRKHSGATSATVRVAAENGTLTFVVEDDGRGFDVMEGLSEHGGFGMHSMRERMEMIGGTLLADSASGRGTRVIAGIPSVPARAPVPSI